MSSDQVLIDNPADGVGRITLNRPESLNALNTAMAETIDQYLAATEQDDDIRAVVLCGAGERAMCAGYDVVEIAAQSDEESKLNDLLRNQQMWNVANFSKPLVTATHGITMGAGAIISVSADIRVGCAETLFQFTASPHGGAMLVWNLPQLVGWSRAKDWLMTSCRISGEDAYNSGLLSRFVPREQVQEHAVEVAATMASYPPRGVMGIKRMIREGLGMDMKSRYRMEVEYAQEMFDLMGNTTGEEYKEFVERSERKKGE